MAFKFPELLEGGLKVVTFGMLGGIALLPVPTGQIKEPIWVGSLNKYRCFIGWHHNDVTNATGAPGSGRLPRASMFNAQGTRHVDHLGIDGHIHELWWDSNGSHEGDLTGATGAQGGCGRRRRTKA